MRARSSKIGSYFLLTLISPIITLYAVLKSRNDQLIVPVGTFIMTLLGSVYVYLPGSDGETHRNTVSSEYLDMSFLEFMQAFFELLILNSSNAPRGINDPYLHTIAFLSGSIFGAPELLHVFAAFVYGLIYFSILRILFQRMTWPKGVSMIAVLFVVFFIYRGITGFNAIRWWTALWLMLYGFLAYWHYGKLKFLGVAALSILIHFSFIAFFVPALGAIWLHRRPEILFIIWIGSFFFGASYQLIKPYIPKLEVIERKEQYTLNEEKLQLSAKARANTPKKETRFYAAIGETSFADYSIPILIVLIFLINQGIIGENKKIIAQAFAAGVLLYSFGNIMEFSPSVHGRAQAGAAPFVLIAMLWTLSASFKYQKRIYESVLLRVTMSLFFISAIPVFLYHLSYAINMLSAFAISFPLASWLLAENDFSIRDFILMLLP